MAKFNVSGARLISEFGERYEDYALDALEKEFVNTAGNIIEDSPIGIPNSERADGEPPQGNFRHNWQISRQPNGRYLTGTSKKGRSYASSKIRGKLKGGRSLFLYNNSPQASVIEFGGYPNPVNRGTYYHKSKKYEIRSAGGFSRQAPQGIVRKNLNGFGRRFRARLKGFR